MHLLHKTPTRADLVVLPFLTLIEFVNTTNLSEDTLNNVIHRFIIDANPGQLTTKDIELRVDLQLI